MALQEGALLNTESGERLNFAQHVLFASLRSRYKMRKTAEENLSAALASVAEARNNVDLLKAQTDDLESALSVLGFPIPEDEA